MDHPETEKVLRASILQLSSLSEREVLSSILRQSELIRKAAVPVRDFREKKPSER